MDRDQILEEIRRTTTENGGKPLGARRFSDETGINQGDWLGKHWARWGDAVREAGFVPNTLQGRFDEGLLLNRYAILVRELGHLPVKDELAMKHHADPSFPSVTTFIKFFGGFRNEAVPRLAEYCERSGEFEDVLQVCRGWAATRMPADKKQAKEKAVALGYVYLLKSGRHFKIGRTNAVGRRERELAIQLPQKGQVIHRIATDDPVGIEAYWHRRFESKRGNGEWFNLSADDLAAFGRRKSM